MAVLNGGFEEPGAEPGGALHWRVRSLVRAWTIAGFGPGPLRAWEDFERWRSPLRLVLESVTVAVFEPRREAFETFEAGWSNDRFVIELPEGSMVIARFAGALVETMAAGWSTEGFATDWAEVSRRGATFDGAAVEAFERRWRDNERFTRAWEEAGSIRARFDARDEERFDGAWDRSTTL
jgi:hypothetical protein